MQIIAETVGVFRQTGLVTLLLGPIFYAQNAPVGHLDITRPIWYNLFDILNNFSHKNTAKVVNIISLLSKLKDKTSSQKIITGALISVFLLCLYPVQSVNAQFVPATPKVLSFTATPPSPIPPGSTTNIAWSLQNGGWQLCVSETIATNLDTESKLCDGASLNYRDNKDFTLNKTTQFIVKSVGGQTVEYKALTVEVKEGATPPDPNANPSIVSFSLTPAQIGAGAGTQILMSWNTANSTGANAAITYRIYDYEGKKDLQTGLVLDTSKADCTKFPTCTLDVTDLGKVDNTLPQKRQVIFSMVLKKGSFTSAPTVAILGINIDVADESGASGPSKIGGSCLSFNLSTMMSCLIVSIISGIISFIVTVIYWTFAFVVSPMIEAILGIHTYSDNFVQVIYAGWLILRNLSNIFFIIILLVIGLATIFQVEKYSYKHLLVQVIIAAIMVNFSLVIGQSVLGIAETVQNQFLSNRGDVVRALGYELMVKPIEQIQGERATGDAGSTFATLTLPFFLLWLAIAAFFTFIAILAFLVVRLVALWILLMVSPLAYVANVLPETHPYFKQWWEKFLANAFIVVILGFFLNLAAVFANSHVFGQGSNVFNQGGGFQENTKNFVFLTASHFTVIFFLWAGLKIASSSGAAGAKAITNFAEKGISKGFKIASGAVLAKPIAEYANEKRLQAHNANLFKPNEKDSALKGFLKKGATTALAPEKAVGTYNKKLADRRAGRNELADARQMSWRSGGIFKKVNATPEQVARYRQAAKRLDEKVVNKDNPAELAKHLETYKDQYDIAAVADAAAKKGNLGTLAGLMYTNPDLTKQEKIDLLKEQLYSKNPDLLAASSFMAALNTNAKEEGGAGKGFVKQDDETGKIYDIKDPNVMEQEKSDAQNRLADNNFAGAALKGDNWKHFDYETDATGNVVRNADGSMKRLNNEAIANGSSVDRVVQAAKFNDATGEIKIEDGMFSDHRLRQMSTEEMKNIKEVYSEQNRDVLERGFTKKFAKEWTTDSATGVAPTQGAINERATATVNAVIDRMREYGGGYDIASRPLHGPAEVYGVPGGTPGPGGVPPATPVTPRAPRGGTPTPGGGTPPVTPTPGGVTPPVTPTPGGPVTGTLADSPLTSSIETGNEVYEADPAIQGFTVAGPRGGSSESNVTNTPASGDSDITVKPIVRINASDINASGGVNVANAGGSVAPNLAVPSDGSSSGAQTTINQSVDNTFNNQNFQNDIKNIMDGIGGSKGTSLSQEDKKGLIDEIAKRIKKDSSQVLRNTSGTPVDIDKLQKSVKSIMARLASGKSGVPESVVNAAKTVKDESATEGNQYNRFASQYTTAFQKSIPPTT